MGEHKYPCPSRHPWTWAIEFHDGTRIEGMSPDDVVERWGRILGWMDGRDLTVPEVIERVFHIAPVLHPESAGELAGIPAASHSAESFLRTLTAAKVLWLIVR